MQTTLYRIGIAAILLYIGGLVVAGIYFVVRTPEPQPTPQITFVCDGGWLVAISAWVDSNHNGIREKDEPPLPNVRFFYASSYLTRDRTQSVPYVSDANGQAKINVFPIGCTPHTYDVYPEIPAGYTVTTPLILRLTAPNGDYEKVQFGFAPIASSWNTVPLCGCSWERCNEAPRANLECALMPHPSTLRKYAEA